MVGRFLFRFATVFCAAISSAVFLAGIALAQQVELHALAEALPEIDQQFADLQLDAHAPGLVYGIVANGRLVHVKAFGVQDTTSRKPLTADSLFRVASMTKTFTALAILRLRDQGELSLDAPAEKYVPELRSWQYPTTDSPPVRVRDLLTHTAGFITDDPWADRQTPLPEADFTLLLQHGVPFNRTPGIAFEYSNLGYALLGRIINNVTKVPYKDFVQGKLLAPLGMHSSGFDVSEAPTARRALGYRWYRNEWLLEPELAHGAFSPIGGLQTNANDYARYVSWLLSAWPARNGTEEGPVRRSSVRELAQGANFLRSRERPTRTGARRCQQAVAYGMGVMVALDCELGETLSHGGGYPGYGSHLLLLPEYGVGIFAFANHTYASLSGGTWDAAMALQRGGAFEQRRLPSTPALNDAYRAVAAMFRAGRVDIRTDLLAINFLMDRSSEAWRQELETVKAEVGECETNSSMNATGALSGTFVWPCKTGRVKGTVHLSPTIPPQIQSMQLTVAPR